ncbi:Glycerol3phosphate acyltransferase_ mitochondrial, partial [Caligus rogercresseyi]
IISLRNNRGECIRLEEILGPVQNVVRSEVTLKHIEQVRCVFPGAFKFFWDKKEDAMAMYPMTMSYL